MWELLVKASVATFNTSSQDLFGNAATGLEMLLLLWTKKNVCHFGLDACNKSWLPCSAI